MPFSLYRQRLCKCANCLINIYVFLSQQSLFHNKNLQKETYMTSPRKNIDTQRQSTMFGELLSIEKQTGALTNQMSNDIESIKRLQTQFTVLQKQAKISTNETVQKTNQEIKQFQQRIKNYLIAQKAQYMRFSNQINQMIQNSKQINAQLTLLGNKFQDFQKNVGIRN